jgi:hypothetical protein
VDAIGNAVRNRTGFSRTRSGEDTHGSFEVAGDFPLLGVKATEDPVLE